LRAAFRAGAERLWRDSFSRQIENVGLDVCLNGVVWRDPAGNLLALPLPTPVEAHGVVFFPTTDLPALQAAIGQVVERMQKLRIPWAGPGRLTSLGVLGAQAPRGPRP